MALRPRIALDWRILVHDRRRFAWSLAGVSLAVVLMFVEMGFYHGSYDAVTLPVAALDADLLVVNRMKEDMFPLEPFPLARLAQARGVEGVRGAYPLYTWLDAQWKNAEDGTVHPIRVIAFDPAHPVWNPHVVDVDATRLTAAGTCLVDAASRDRYGTLEAGRTAELDGRRVRIAGLFSLGPDLVIDGTVLMGRATFATFFTRPGAAGSLLDDVEFGVVQLEPGRDAQAVKDELRRRLLHDVAVMTPDEFTAVVHAYWRRNQPVGSVFLTGMVIGFVIGVMICYQVLFTEVADNLSQYATLKAIGYRNRYLVATVLRQGLWLALLAFAIGGLAAGLLYGVIGRAASMPMTLTAGRALVVLASTVAMCSLAAAIAIRRVLRSDPAEVFG